MKDNRESILAKVQGLYAKAAATDFGPEAEAFTAKADELMLKYAIEQAELAMDDATLHEFQLRKFTIDYGVSNIGYVQYELLRVCAHHCGLIITPGGTAREFEYAGSRMDLDFMEVLYTNLLGHLVKTLDPKPDPNADEAENLYGLKMAGFSWREVHERMYPDVPWERRHGVRYTGVVKKFAEERGLERNMVGGRRGQQNYREQYASAYINRLTQRLMEIRGDQSEARESAALVLYDKEAKLKDFLWDKYPDLRPHPDDCDCDKCHRCSDSKCQRTRCVNARKPMPRVPRGRMRTFQYNPTANAAGRRAANSADLGQTRVSGRKKELG